MLVDGNVDVRTTPRRYINAKPTSSRVGKIIIYFLKSDFYLNPIFDLNQIFIFCTSK